MPGPASETSDVDTGGGSTASVPRAAGLIELPPPPRLASYDAPPTCPLQGRQGERATCASSMIVPGDAHRLCDVLVLHRGFEHHAFGELLDHRALDFLPRCLARRILVAAPLLQGGAALRKLGLRDQDVRRALVEIDTHSVAGLEQREPGDRVRID